MFIIRQKFNIADKYGISVEGDSQLLKNGMRLKDENGNIFVIESIGMVNYKNINDYKKNAELFLIGDIKNIGTSLIIVEENYDKQRRFVWNEQIFL